MLNPRAAAFCAPLAVALLVGAPGVGVARDRHFTVVFHSATLPAGARALIESTGARVISEVPEIGMMRVEGPTSLLVTLNAMPAIQAASPSITFRLPMQPRSAPAASEPAVDTSQADLYEQLQWDIKQVTNDGASFGMWTGSHQTVVAIVGSGINTQHPDLKANILHLNPNDPGGRNFVPGPDGTLDPNDIEDREGHGTYCAGAVAAKGRILGVGPDLAIRAYRVTGGSGDFAWFVDGMIAAANDGVDVISMSLYVYDGISGYTWTDPDTGTVYELKDIADFLAFKRAARYVVNAGVVLVVAATGDAINISNPKAITNWINEEYGPFGYHVWGATREVPGTLPGALTVSATGPDKSPASYTSYGPGAIDISAPGGEISGYSDITPTPRYWDPYYYDFCLGADLEVWGWYNWWAGTSMATPKVAAVAALIIDQAKAEGRRLTPAQVVARLQQTAIDLGKPGYDMYYGYGMVNAVSALKGK